MNTTASQHADTLSDLRDAIGDPSFDHQQLRMRCLEKAMTATPQWEVESQIPEILITARRFAEFVLTGETRNIVIKPQASDR